jgi:hypothetical protein
MSFQAAIDKTTKEVRVGVTNALVANTATPEPDKS